MSNGSVYLNIPIIGRLISIMDEVFCKIRVSVDGMVRRKKFLLETSQPIETHLDVVAKVLEVQSSVYFEFCLDEEFTEFGEMISCF